MSNRLTYALKTSLGRGWGCIPHSSNRRFASGETERSEDARRCRASLPYLSALLLFSLANTHSVQAATAEQFIQACDEVIRSVFPSSIRASQERLEELLETATKLDGPPAQSIGRNFLLSSAGLHFPSNVLAQAVLPLTQDQLMASKANFATTVELNNSVQPHRSDILQDLMPRIHMPGIYALHDDSFAFVSNFGAPISKITCGLVLDDPSVVLESLEQRAREPDISSNGTQVLHVEDKAWQPPYTYIITILNDQVAQAMNVPRVYVAMSGDPQ